MSFPDPSETKCIITGLLTSSPLRCTINQLSNDFRNTIGCPIPFRVLGFESVEQYLRSIPDTVHIHGSGPSAEVRGIVTDKSAHINHMVAKQRKNAIPAHKKKYLKPPTAFTTQTVFPRNTNPQPSLDHEEEYRSKIPKRVQNQLRKLMMQHPEGIWCTKLPDLFRKMFNEEIKYEVYNFRSISELCTDLSDIFHYVQPTSDDYILYDKNSAVPQLNQNEVAKVEHTNSEINWSLGSGLIPDDIVQFLDEIPQLSLTDMKIGDQLDICIGEIYDIHHFYVYPKYSDLKRYLEELSDFFNSRSNLYCIPDLFCVEGLYCITYYNNKYLRCVIVDSLPRSPDSIKVLFIDYGSVGQVSIKDVWYMPVQFSTMPCQAMEARLSHIKSNGNNEGTTEKFKQLSTRREIVAEVMKLDDKERILEVYLADVTHADHIFYINDALVEKGYAAFC